VHGHTSSQCASAGLMPAPAPPAPLSPMGTGGDGGSEGSRNISIAIRLRPLLETEKRRGGKHDTIDWMANHNDTCTIYDHRTGEVWPFDYVFGPEIETQEVFDSCAREIVDSCCRGFNGTICAYGQTASGKTYTMEGVSGVPGIIQLAVHEIFKSILHHTDRQYIMSASYLEIYDEQIIDLLNDDPSAPEVKVFDNDQGGVEFKNLTFRRVSTGPQDILDCLADGAIRKHMGETRMNDRSSRSHSILGINLESVRQGDQTVRVSQLNLVDLAGSEGLRHTESRGDRRREGPNINTSLLTLAMVINALSETSCSGKQPQHIGFRSSKLTRILQRSLGGNCQTLLICTLSPASSNYQESRSTLMFANRAKQVKNTVMENVYAAGERSLICKVEYEIADLQAKYRKLRPGKKEDLADKIVRLKRLLFSRERLLTGPTMNPDLCDLESEGGAGAMRRMGSDAGGAEAADLRRRHTLAVPPEGLPLCDDEDALKSEADLHALDMGRLQSANVAQLRMELKMVQNKAAALERELRQRSAGNQHGGERRHGCGRGDSGATERRPPPPPAGNCDTGCAAPGAMFTPSRCSRIAARAGPVIEEMESEEDADWQIRAVRGSAGTTPAASAPAHRNLSRFTSSVPPGRKHAAESAAAEVVEGEEDQEDQEKEGEAARGQPPPCQEARSPASSQRGHQRKGSGGAQKRAASHQDRVSAGKNLRGVQGSKPSDSSNNLAADSDLISASLLVRRLREMGLREDDIVVNALAGISTGGGPPGRKKVRRLLAEATARAEALVAADEPRHSSTGSDSCAVASVSPLPVPLCAPSPLPVPLPAPPSARLPPSHHQCEDVGADGASGGVCAIDNMGRQQCRPDDRSFRAILDREGEYPKRVCSQLNGLETSDAAGSGRTDHVGPVPTRNLIEELRELDCKRAGLAETLRMRGRYSSAAFDQRCDQDQDDGALEVDGGCVGIDRIETVSAAEKAAAMALTKEAEAEAAHAAAAADVRAAAYAEVELQECIRKKKREAEETLAEIERMRKDAVQRAQARSSAEATSVQAASRALKAARQAEARELGEQVSRTAAVLHRANEGHGEAVHAASSRTISRQAPQQAAAPVLTDENKEQEDVEDAVSMDGSSLENCALGKDQHETSLVGPPLVPDALRRQQLREEGGRCDSWPSTGGARRRLSGSFDKVAFAEECGGAARSCCERSCLEGERRRTLGSSGSHCGDGGSSAVARPGSPLSRTALPGTLSPPAECSAREPRELDAAQLRHDAKVRQIQEDIACAESKLVSMRAGGVDRTERTKRPRCQEELNSELHDMHCAGERQLPSARGRWADDSCAQVERTAERAPTQVQRKGGALASSCSPRQTPAACGQWGDGGGRREERTSVLAPAQVLSKGGVRVGSFSPGSTASRAHGDRTSDAEREEVEEEEGRVGCGSGVAMASPRHLVAQAADERRLVVHESQLSSLAAARIEASEMEDQCLSLAQADRASRVGEDVQRLRSRAQELEDQLATMQDPGARFPKLRDDASGSEASLSGHAAVSSIASVHGRTRKHVTTGAGVSAGHLRRDDPEQCQQQ